MKIIKIQIKDFRAFRGEYTIDLPDGRNLILYGENGSGKSSLFHALNYFFATASPFSNHKNIFAPTEDGYVKVEIGDGTNPSKVYEWEHTVHPSTEVLIVEASKTKGFMDYRSILETHFVHRGVTSVNVFGLLVNVLMANTQNPVTQTFIAEEWHTIQAISQSRRNKSRSESLNQLLKDFNAGMTNLLGTLTTNANQILDLFGQSVSISLGLARNGLAYDFASKTINNQVINLTAKYYGHELTSHHLFLNEARLSAIAISIYLGALLLNPPSQLRIMFLDDLLIGLDMSNRLPLLGILDNFFRDWQIVLTTFDRVWFDMARLRLKDPFWAQGELYTAKTVDGDVPVYAKDKDYLAIAQKHLAANDLKAAAIYIRSEYEHIIRRFCAKHRLSIVYCENSKDQRSDDFWQVVKLQRRKSGSTSIISEAIIRDIELYRTSILNQLSHTAPVNLARREVEDACQTIENLRNELRSVRQGDLS